jgi:protein-tyrosine kinase
MKGIREAIDRAKAGDFNAAERRPPDRQDLGVPPINDRLTTFDRRIQEIELDAAYLRSRRIIAHDEMDANTTSFDMLRTQVLQAMDLKDWKLLGVTSPTPGCGKTVTAINLALSIARQPERSVLLVDLDLRKPNVAKSLGLEPREGVLSILKNQTTLTRATIHAHVGSVPLMVLPTEAPVTGSSDRMASRAMSAMLLEIKTEYQSPIIVLDLPPVLSRDDVLAILPRLDCLLLVAAVGTSTIAEISECNKHVHSTEIMRIVLTKVPSSRSKYYY